VRLYVNIDHAATLRQARATDEPDPVRAAVLAELAGADGITVHLREDRRHIQDRDVVLLLQTVRSVVNLELAATDEMVRLAVTLRPHQATLVPERREEITTEGGLDCVHGAEPRHGVPDPPRPRHAVEPALGRDLLAALRHQRRLVRLQPLGDRENLPGRRQLEIHHRAHRRDQQLDVPVLDVPAILAQVHGDAVGARLLDQHGEAHRIGLVGLARLTHRRRMVDVDVESHACSPPGRPLASPFVTPTHRLPIIACLVALVGCAGRPAGVTPAPTPEATVGQFLAAVNANDLERMAALFGDEHGRTRWGSSVARQERLAIMQRLLRADSSRVLGNEPDSTGVATRRLVHAELFGTDRRVRVPFIVARQTVGGWLVYAIGLAPLMPTPGGRRSP
jgi:hypothetical protein